MKERVLLRNETALKRFPNEIKDFIEMPEGRIVVLLKVDYNSIDDRNVFCITRNGDEIWQIQSNEYPDGPSIVTSIKVQEGNLFVFRMVGVEEQISIETGEIISSKFVK